MRLTSYRYPNEYLILILTFILLLVVGIFIAGSTLCLAPLFIIIVILFAYQINQSHHRALLRQGIPVSKDRTPALYALANDCQQRLSPGPLKIFVVPGRSLNAYTFGFSNPKGLVIYSPVIKIMDEDELRFILGHEMGHVALGHTWLNTLLGGMAGVPTPFGAAVLITLAFRWWNRACEFSADRAGLLACSKPRKAVSALIKLVAGDVQSTSEMERALQIIDQEDDSPMNVLLESLSTHPTAIRRIEQLQRYAASPEYNRHLRQINNQTRRK